MDVAVLGAGYVGLIVGAALANVGNSVVAYDIERTKLEELAAGHCSMYEPGLADLVRNQVQSGRLRFTASLEDAVRHGDVILISVPTPADEDGAADLSAVADVAGGIGDAIEAHGREDDAPVIVVKSTVPVGTADFVESIVASRTTSDFAVASNPEFFREGSALRDFGNPARVIVGTDDERARRVLARLYAPFLGENQGILFMDTRSAELTKYANNAMLALRVAFMNEMAELAEATGADIEQIRRGVGSDPRIGPSFLKAGIGFGGACMPKDVEALIGVGREYNTVTPLLTAAADANSTQWTRLVVKVAEHFDGEIRGVRVAVWGATYKPNTSDIRDSPACRVLDALLELGARPVVYEPSGPESLLAAYGDRIEVAEDEYAALTGCAALLVLTDWDQFKTPDFARIAKRLERPVVFDGRSLYDPAALAEQGLLHYAIGRTDPDHMAVVEALAKNELH